MSFAGQRRQLHLPQHAGQPHGGGHADLQVQVGALELHDHPKELVRFGLVGHRFDGCFDDGRHGRALLLIAWTCEDCGDYWECLLTIRPIPFRERSPIMGRLCRNVTPSSAAAT